MPAPETGTALPSWGAWAGAQARPSSHGGKWGRDRGRPRRWRRQRRRRRSRRRSWLPHASSGRGCSRRRLVSWSSTSCSWKDGVLGKSCHRPAPGLTSRHTALQHPPTNPPTDLGCPGISGPSPSSVEHKLEVVQHPPERLLGGDAEHQGVPQRGQEAVELCGREVVVADAVEPPGGGGVGGGLICVRGKGQSSTDHAWHVSVGMYVSDENQHAHARTHAPAVALGGVCLEALPVCDEGLHLSQGRTQMTGWISCEQNETEDADMQTCMQVDRIPHPPRRCR